MPEIREHSDIVTQITTVKVPPTNQPEVLELMAERARFMATQPGFVSVSLHRSEDGSHVVNYVQWRNRKLLEAAHHYRVPQAVAALRRVDQGSGAMPLRGHARRGGVIRTTDDGRRTTDNGRQMEARPSVVCNLSSVIRSGPRARGLRACRHRGSASRRTIPR